MLLQNGPARGSCYWMRGNGEWVRILETGAAPGRNCLRQNGREVEKSAERTSLSGAGEGVEPGNGGDAGHSELGGKSRIERKAIPSGTIEVFDNLGWKHALKIR